MNGIETEAIMIAQLKQRVINHNWAWETSTDKNTYLNGQVNLRNIHNLLHPLATIHKLDVATIMEGILNDTPLIQTDSSDGDTSNTHTHIVELFQPYKDWEHIGDSHYDNSMSGIVATSYIV